jgi:hypothetical protein
MMADNRIPPGPLEQGPTPLFLPIEDRLRLLHRALANIRLGAWDRRIVEWMAKSTDTSTSSRSSACSSGRRRPSWRLPVLHLLHA